MLFLSVGTRRLHDTAGLIAQRSVSPPPLWKLRTLPRNELSSAAGTPGAVQILAQRAIQGDHATRNRWVVTYPSALAQIAQKAQGSGRTAERLDETLRASAGRVRRARKP